MAAMIFNGKTVLLSDGIVETFVKADHACKGSVVFPYSDL